MNFEPFKVSSMAVISAPLRKLMRLETASRSDLMAINVPLDAILEIWKVQQFLGGFPRSGAGRYQDWCNPSVPP